MVFQCRTDYRQIHLFHIVRENDQMGIAHIDCDALSESIAFTQVNGVDIDRFAHFYRNGTDGSFFIRMQI